MPKKTEKGKSTKSPPKSKKPSEDIELIERIEPIEVIDENEFTEAIENQQATDIVEVEACCRLQLPGGFKFLSETDPPVDVCFDYSKLNCIKSAIIKQVTICEETNPVQCNAVIGYSVTLVGDIDINVSTPIIPAVRGRCFNNIPSHTCCAKTVSVNQRLACTCSPIPCQPGATCVNIVSFTVTPILESDECGDYLLVIVSIGLQYNGSC